MVLHDFFGFCAYNIEKLIFLYFCQEKLLQSYEKSHKYLKGVLLSVRVLEYFGKIL